MHGMRHRKKDGCLRKEASRATKGKKGLNDEDKSMLFYPGIASGSAFEEHRRDAALK